MSARASDPTIQSLVQFPGQDGEALVVKSGGQISIETGAKLFVGGADVTAAVATGGVAGVAAGYAIARGETALDGSNPTPIVTGLSVITGVTLAMKKNSAPGVGTSVLTYDTSGGTLNLYGWKVTATGDATLIASTGTETVGWTAVGTL